MNIVKIIIKYVAILNSAVLIMALIYLIWSNMRFELPFTDQVLVMFRVSLLIMIGLIITLFFTNSSITLHSARNEDKRVINIFSKSSCLSLAMILPSSIIMYYYNKKFIGGAVTTLLVITIILLMLGLILSIINKKTRSFHILVDICIFTFSYLMLQDMKNLLGIAVYSATGVTLFVVIIAAHVILDTAKIGAVNNHNMEKE